MTVGQRERLTQNRVVKLFREELDYRYLGEWEDRSNNSNIEETLLSAYLSRRGYSAPLVAKSLYALRTAANNPNETLYTNNKNVYKLLRYGAQVQAAVGENHETVHFINWQDATKNDFAIAEEVTVRGQHDKRPDIVLYVNGIALAFWNSSAAPYRLATAFARASSISDRSLLAAFFLRCSLYLPAMIPKGCVTVLLAHRRSISCAGKKMSATTAGFSWTSTC